MSRLGETEREGSKHSNPLLFVPLSRLMVFLPMNFRSLLLFFFLHSLPFLNVNLTVFQIPIYFTTVSTVSWCCYGYRSDEA